MREPFDVGVPSESDLARLYHALGQIGAPSVGRRAPWRFAPTRMEELLALAGEMLRYDARLLSILLELMLARWRDVNPLHLREELARMRWPQALLVVFEFAKAASSDDELRYFVEYLCAGFARVSPSERFFIDTARPGSRMERRRRERSLAQYSRWGFFAVERPSVSSVTKQTVGRYDSASRRRVRRVLAERRGPFALADYLEALDGSISRQQAYDDLRRDRDFEVRGRGRGARWHLST